jgi:hypothetical protein
MTACVDDTLIAAEMFATLQGEIERAEAELATIMAAIADANSELQELHTELRAMGLAREKLPSSIPPAAR